MEYTACILYVIHYTVYCHDRWEMHNGSTSSFLIVANLHTIVYQFYHRYEHAFFVESHNWCLDWIWGGASEVHLF